MLRPLKMAVLAEGKFGVLTSKTAACIIRYQPERVACVIDSTKSGLTAESVLGFGGPIPVVASLKEALTHQPDCLLIGIAPRGGMLPGEWHGIVLDAIEQGLNVVSGLHTMLSDDAEISRAADARGVQIWDIREPVMPDGILQGLLRDKKGRVILTVGSDCRTGKMTVAYELARSLTDRGVSAKFVATGQTGILLDDWGAAVDRVPGDFMARVVEDLTVSALSSAEVAVVEGQGSLLHPGYSGVSLAIMHGCYPDFMIMCHHPTRREIEGYGVRIPSVTELIRIHEQACSPIFPSEVVAVALNTYDLTEDDAAAEIAAVERETGLPATDVIRWGCAKIVDALVDVL